jgi:vanillate O-demethylase ferredoxin subunit
MTVFFDKNVRPVRLMAIRLVAEQVNLYEFAPLDGVPLEPFEPGAHIDLHLTEGLVRQYSLLPHEGDALRIAVQIDGNGRGGSRFLARDARVGDVFQVSAPRNHFPLVSGMQHTVLIAGGIGITPLYGMIDRLAREGASWELHYAAKSDARTVFRNELRRHGDKVHIARSDCRDDSRLDLRELIAAAPIDSELYCCGPQRMVDAFIEAARTRPQEKVHVERFSAATQIADEGGFEVRLAHSDRQFSVPSGSTILQTLRNAGLDLPSSCEQGVCGVCETRVLSGQPDHRDHVLSAAERAKGETMMICCSGSRSKVLVLDM